MFKAKVYQYSNINGKENKIEREFDNEQDYQNFIQNNENQSMFGFNWWSLREFNKYLDDFFDRKLGYDFWETENELPYFENSPVDLSKYEQELRKIENDKKAKEAKKNQLESTLSKLREYRKKFKEEWKDDLVKNIDSDISKVQEELKQA